jgi:hypothetical protein
MSAEIALNRTSSDSRIFFSVGKIFRFPLVATRVNVFCVDSAFVLDHTGLHVFKTIRLLANVDDPTDLDVSALKQTHRLLTANVSTGIGAL